MSHQSYLSANYNSNYEVELEVVHISPGIYLTVKEYPENPQLEDRLIKVLRPVIAPNGVSFLQITSVGSHIRNGKRPVVHGAMGCG